MNFYMQPPPPMSLFKILTQVISPDFDEILYVRFLATAVVIFGSKNPREEISPQIRRDFTHYKVKW